MFSKSFRSAIGRDAIQTLSTQQRQILYDLSERGPGLLVELAVRQLALPEQVSAPLAELRERGLVRGEQFAGGPLGNELYFLTEAGQQAVIWLHEEAATSGASPSGVARSLSAAGHDARWQEVDLLRRLGDLADRTGEFDQARVYYRQALELTQALAEGRQPYSSDRKDD